LPLRVGERETGRAISEPGPTEFRQFFVQSPVVIAIVGPGGTGKSTVACHLARWALADNPEERLTEHLMIPIFLEEETDNLVGSIIRHLRQIVGPEEVDELMVDSLLRNQRLLVIVDALSERTIETRKNVQSIFGTVVLKTLATTSRPVAESYGRMSDSCTRGLIGGSRPTR
jgi:predicted NACHT family NTPase